MPHDNGSSNEEPLRELWLKIRSSQQDLAACGPATVHLLNEIDRIIERSYSDLSKPSRQSQLARAISLSSSLFRLADEKILSFNYKDLPVCWRRIYTDATLLKTIAHLLDNTSEDASKLSAALLQSIKELDLCVIVAGAPGKEREEIVFSLIKTVQNKLRQLSKTITSVEIDLNFSQRPIKRQKLTNESNQAESNSFSAETKKLASPGVQKPIPRLEIPPSLTEFLSRYSKSPFILTGGCREWPAVQKWGNAEYLREIAGIGRVVPVEIGNSYTSNNWGQQIIPFSQFLDKTFAATELQNDTDTIYLAQHDLFRQFPVLANDIQIPDYVYSAPEPTKDAPEYIAPSNQFGYTMNAWLGPAATLSPPHTDPYFNCYAQVVGRKWVWVAPPSAASSMYTYGPDLNLSGPADAEDEVDESSNSHLMTNTSKIDVSLDSKTHETRFPAFVQHVVPVAQQAVLEPGDLLFMPPGWWHSMKSLDVSFSVSIWF